MHRPESPGVVEAYRRAVVGLENDVVVGLERPQRRCRRDHAAGHTEMHHRDTAVIEVNENKLGAPTHPLHTAPLQPFDESRRQRKPQIWPPLDDPAETASLEFRRQAAANRFYFRQFRHDIDLTRDEMPAT
jgi:hypothetical protein